VKPYSGPDQIALFWFVGLPVASFGHGVLLLLVLLGRSAGPMIPPDTVMEVAMVTLHREANVLPEKVMVKPPQVTGDMGAVEEFPVVEDQLVLEVDEADEAEGEEKTPESDEERQERREDLIARANDVPVGPEDQLPTDPDSTVTDLRDVYLAGDGTNAADPELAAYIRDCKQRVMAKWNVMPSIANENPDLTVVIGIRIDDSGKILKAKIVDNSGNRQYDMNTLTAVRRMGSLPAPPSDKILGYAEGGVFIRFVASDKVF
jgi:TonB family protein